MTMRPPRICVFGAGGVGGYLAAMLCRAGRDVCLVARGEHLQAIQRSGLRVTDRSGSTISLAIKAGDSLDVFGPIDVLIITVKATAQEAAAEAVGPYLQPETSVVFAVNGVFWFYEG